MYRRLRLQVVPALAPSRADPAFAWKRPALEKWTEFQNALAPDSVYLRWYDPVTGEHRNRRNMGIITGRASGGVFAIDLDIKPNCDGRTWWHGVLAAETSGLEPDTPAQRTGGGGRQILFRAPPGWEPPTFKTSIGVDLRGNGGFIICSPSIHASGQIYDWERGRAPWELEIETAEPWLCAAIDKLHAEHGGTATGGAKRERTASDGDKNAFGRDTDGREEKLQRIAWALALELRRECPIRPADAEIEQRLKEAFDRYELTTKSRLDPRPGYSNADLLELEERGISELRKKLAYALGQWEEKLKGDAENPPEPDPEPEPEPAPEPKEPGAEPPNRPFSVAEHAQPEDRRWLVVGWVALGELNSLYGAGATGKSLLALQLAYCAAGGLPWLGLKTEKCKVLFVSCEDDRRELARRHVSIKAALGYPVGNPFGDLSVWDRTGEDNRLAIEDGKGGVTAGPFMAELKAALAELKPGLLVLDTLADIFGGNENNRVHVNAFLKTTLGGLIAARRKTGDELTILALGHPSKPPTGKESKPAEFSGSTAWENAVRSRLTLRRPDGAGADLRVLERGKANYAGGDDDALSLIWGEGVFVAFDPKMEAELVELVGLVTREIGRAWDAEEPFMEQRSHPRYLHRALPEKLMRAPNPPSRMLISKAVERAISDGLIKSSGNKSRRGWRLQ